MLYLKTRGVLRGIFFAVFIIVVGTLITVNVTGKNVVLTLREPLASSILHKDDKIIEMYNYSGERGSNNKLPEHWFIKLSPDFEQLDVSDYAAGQILHTSSQGFFFDLKRSAELTEESMRQGNTKVYNACSSPAAITTNFSFTISYAYDSPHGQSGCSCSSVASINTEVQFIDGESDTTYSLPLEASEAISTERVAATSVINADGSIIVTAWPNDEGYNFSDRIISFCIVPACSCGSFIVYSFMTELS